MCGIAGFLRFEVHCRDEAVARVKRMADALIHRGPDEEGLYVDDLVALGHRRLSIIDLSAGQQPMGALDGKIQIVFNGEIYNFMEVRAQLKARGYRFRSHCDTEVILLSYAEWGDRCVERLNGMFAFAIWDSRVKRLFLARDRVGKKPLYYWQNETVFAFASELKALRAGGFCPDSVDPESLDCYLTFGYIPAPRTIYRGVKKLRAAHSLAVGAQKAAEGRYWSLNFSEPRQISLDEAVEQFEPLLDEAVRCRLTSDVPIGAFLSGGIDSALVVSSMARLLNRPVITHSIGFEEREHSELAAANTIANYVGADHHEYTVAPDAVSTLERIAWHFDEPFADSSALPTWYVCQMTRRSVTVALSGDGGDEAFGGYTFRYLPHLWESYIRRAVPMGLRSALFGTLGRLWPGAAKLPKPLRLRTIFENLAVGDAEAFYRDLVSLRADVRRSIYSSDFLGMLQGFTPMEALAPYYGHKSAPDALGRSQLADIQFYMTEDVLVKVDRMSMAHSLEVRSPLLDHRILEFAARLPTCAKMSHRQGKLPLRRLAARRLPAGVHKLPKRGFSIPAAKWLKGELRPLIEELLFDNEGLPTRVLQKEKLQDMWVEHLQGQRNHSSFLWGLMMLAMWERVMRKQAGGGAIA